MVVFLFPPLFHTVKRMDGKNCVRKECTYDKAEDILNIQLRGYGESIELQNGIVIDVDKDGSVMGL